MGDKTTQIIFFGIMTGFCALSFFIFFFLRTPITKIGIIDLERTSDKLLSQEKAKKEIKLSFFKEVQVKTIRTLQITVSKQMIPLLPAFFYTGVREINNS